MSLLLILLVVVALLALGILGAVIEGLLWLLAIVTAIVVAGAVYLYVRFKGSAKA